MQALTRNAPQESSDQRALSWILVFTLSALASVLFGRLLYLGLMRGFSTNEMVVCFMLPSGMWVYYRLLHRVGSDKPTILLVTALALWGLLMLESSMVSGFAR